MNVPSGDDEPHDDNTKPQTIGDCDLQESEVEAVEAKYELPKFRTGRAIPEVRRIARFRRAWVFRLAERKLSDEEWDEAVKTLEKRRYAFWAQLSDAMVLEQVIAQAEADTDAKVKCRSLDVI